jgi:oligopeptide/dipeptide ABC transporter ATP-binding protein
MGEAAVTFNSLGWDDAIFEVKDLEVQFKVKGGRKLRALDRINISVGRNKSLGVAGESGSGKTTLGKALLRIQKPTAGKVLFEGKDIFKLKGKDLREFQRRAQMVFQDPFDAIDPLFSVYDAVSEGIRVGQLEKSKEKMEAMISDALTRVQLTPPEEFMHRRITSLSGGQRQRVALARSLAMNPKVLVLDEPVSMLDASVRGGVISLMDDLKKRGTTFVTITHDIATVRYFTDTLVIMYLGQVVEIGATKEVVSQPLHPYTQALIAAVPVPDPSTPVKALAKGEIANAIAPPSGCRFHPRCPMAQEICETDEPKLREIKRGRYASCHFA